MSELSFWQNGQYKVVPFDGQPMLIDVLYATGYLIEHPCGAVAVVVNVRLL